MKFWGNQYISNRNQGSHLDRRRGYCWNSVEVGAVPYGHLKKPHKKEDETESHLKCFISNPAQRPVHPGASSPAIYELI